MSRFQHLEFEGEPSRRDRLESKPPQTTPELDLAFMAFDQACFDPSIRLFNRILECHTSCEEAWEGLIWAYLETNQLQLADRWADVALRQLPNSGLLAAAKAMALGRNGDHASAMAYSDTALEVRSDAANVWLARGDVLMAKQDPAFDYCMDKAELLGASHWRTLWRIARSFAFHQKFALSMKAAKKCLEADSSQAMSWFQLAFAQFSLGLVQPARHSLLQARQLAPRHEIVESLWTELNQAGWWNNALKRLKGCLP